MMRWKVLSALIGLGLFSGLWVTANALVSIPNPELGAIIHVGSPVTSHPSTPPDSTDIPSTDTPTTPTQPPASADGAVPVDSPQSCFAGPDDDDDDDNCDDSDDSDNDNDEDDDDY